MNFAFFGRRAGASGRRPPGKSLRRRHAIIHESASLSLSLSACRRKLRVRCIISRFRSQAHLQIHMTAAAQLFTRAQKFTRERLKGLFVLGHWRRRRATCAHNRIFKTQFAAINAPQPATHTLCSTPVVGARAHHQNQKHSAPFFATIL